MRNVNVICAWKSLRLYTAQRTVSLGAMRRIKAFKNFYMTNGFIWQYEDNRKWQL